MRKKAMPLRTDTVRIFPMAHCISVADSVAYPDSSDHFGVHGAAPPASESAGSLFSLRSATAAPEKGPGAEPGDGCSGCSCVCFSTAGAGPAAAPAQHEVMQAQGLLT